MKLIIQYVSQASVTAPRESQVHIARGYVVLVGLGKHDSPTTIYRLLDQMLSGRYIPDEKGKINLSIQDIKGEILLVPQFTLYWDVSKGNRPGFQRAAPPENANDLFKQASNYLHHNKSVSVKAGFFGAHMQLHLTNDGPITVILEN